ncbi:putative nitrite reductase [Salmonella enterica subsp. enterica]|uniref:Putative nitrite reductase n=1 Tax=Salmonella enterica I TaxID=59201 RepID=A0A3S4HS75_SALET|nr:putative nitrite reductase [Salmonella enterica subsp. enterica]
MPQWGDVNFDGYPDLSIVTELLAGPDAPVQTWLYDPAKQRYVDAPASYQEITSPEIDAEHKQIVSYWRGGCCSHGVNVYRWKGKND